MDAQDIANVIDEIKGNDSIKYLLFQVHPNPETGLRVMVYTVHDGKQSCLEKYFDLRKPSKIENIFVEILNMVKLVNIDR